MGGGGWGWVGLGGVGLGWVGWDGLSRWPQDRFWHLALACVARSCARACGGVFVIEDEREGSVYYSLQTELHVEPLKGFAITTWCWERMQPPSGPSTDAHRLRTDQLT